MIPKKLSDITFEDIQRLKTEQVREGKTIEYKSQVPDNVKFLKGVSALANTSGGDFIIGIQETDGIPSAVQGIQISDVDGEILRLENILRTGLEPRLVDHNIHSIQVKDDNYVLVIRIPQSWNAPHRVVKDSKFYGRNSAGTYPLDVSELRLAFTLSEQVSDRIRNFRADRIAKVYGDETPVPLMEGSKLLLHLMPLSAFTTQNRIDISAFYQDREKKLPTIGCIRDSGWGSMLNIDGVISYSDNFESVSPAYTQLFRSGIIEAVRVYPPYQDEKSIPIVVYEQDILKIVPSYLKILSELEIQPPFYLFISMLGIKDYQLKAVNQVNWYLVRNAVDRDILQLPEIVIDSFEVKLEKTLKESFDMIWNAFGFSHSFSYDDKGNRQ